MYKFESPKKLNVKNVLTFWGRDSHVKCPLQVNPPTITEPPPPPPNDIDSALKGTINKLKQILVPPKTIYILI